MWKRGRHRCISLPYRGAANAGNSASPSECRACAHEDSAVRGRAAERLPGQGPAGAAARAEQAYQKAVDFTISMSKAKGINLSVFSKPCMHWFRIMREDNA